MNIDFYTSKHALIEQLLSAIERSIGEGLSEKNVTAVFTVLTKLSSTVNTHLVSEDTYLYPELFNSLVPETRRIAALYKDEMLQISDNFRMFVDMFATKESLLTQKNEFITYFTALASSLRERIAREEKELYKLI
ncbi:hemerythrin domain-containing protein [Treponema sp. HNW]|uniref:hemerythrin domain-containing protein n=1 Tax=Treponema sp. HNW TaxID=3116654 RepID=UPI003D13FE7C